MIDATQDWPIRDRIRAAGGKAVLGVDGKPRFNCGNPRIVAEAWRSYDSLRRQLIEELVDRMDVVWRIIREIEPRTPEVTEYMAIIDAVYGAWAQGDEAFCQALAEHGRRAMSLAATINSQRPLEGEGLYHAVERLFADMAKPDTGGPKPQLAVVAARKPQPEAQTATGEQGGLF